MRGNTEVHTAGHRLAGIGSPLLVGAWRDHSTNEGTGAHTPACIAEGMPEEEEAAEEQLVAKMLFVVC